MVIECRSVTSSVGREQSSLIQLLRSKRFDFTMFGCSDCKPVMECHTDSYCRYKKGDRYTCQFRCCSFRCVIASYGTHRDTNFFHAQAHEDAVNGSGDDQQYHDFPMEGSETEGALNNTETTLSSVELNISTEQSTTLIQQDDIQETNHDEDG